jgi:23S rRNA (adenine2503-C2)-methyltransferase
MGVLLLLIANKQVSKDSTIKYTLMTEDEHLIESCVLFFEEDNAPVIFCISSQVGCPNSCEFCTSGHRSFIRNLTCNEITQQVEIMMNDICRESQYPFEITYMGIGEPLLNLSNTLLSAEEFIENYPSLVRLNISTILPSIKIDIHEFLFLKGKVRFQLSLHFMNDELREKVFNKKLPSIIESLDFLNRVSEMLDDIYCINYILIEGLNDSVEDARSLVSLSNTNSRLYIKVSEFAPIEESNLKSSSRLQEFYQFLKDNGVKCKYFINKGKDIHASCGHFLAQIRL